MNLINLDLGKQKAKALESKTFPIIPKTSDCDAKVNILQYNGTAYNLQNSFCLNLVTFDLFGDIQNYKKGSN